MKDGEEDSKRILGEERITFFCLVRDYVFPLTWNIYS